MNSIAANLTIHYASQYVAFLAIRTFEYYTSSSKPRVADQNLKNAEVIEVKRNELHERAFTTFCSENWDSDQLDSLAELARQTFTPFEPYNQAEYSNKSEKLMRIEPKKEEDSYDKNTSFIRRSFVEGSPKQGFKEIETIKHPFSDDGSLMAHPLVNSVLSYIYQLLPDEMRPNRDRIEISLIRQTASRMRELEFHRDRRRQVFILLLKCNIKESEGAEMSVIDWNKLTKNEQNFYMSLGQSAFLPPVGEDIKHHYSNMPSAKGNGYLLREDTVSTDHQSIHHRRGAFFTNIPNPERITLRILVEDKDTFSTEAI